MKRLISTIIIAFLLVATITSSVSAISIGDVTTENLEPGKEGKISIELINDLDYDLEDISFKIILENLPLIPSGSSEETIKEIEEDDDKTLSFKVQASNNIAPGDYEIPYSLNYNNPETNQTVIKTGTIGIRVKANPKLTYSIETETPILNQKGKITLKMVNKGFFDARFVSLKITQSGFTLLSNSEEYIGKIDSDDYETATFDVIYTSKSPTLTAKIEYLDFDNEKITENINLPLKVYSEERAIELGLMNKDNNLLYVGIAIGLIVLWIVYRTIKKRRKLKKSMQNRS